MNPNKIRRLWSNATIITLDREQPQAEAMVTVGETIAFVGTQAQAQALVDRKTEEISLEGRVVVPGFNDNHLHLVIHGDHAAAPDLSGLSEEQIVERMVDFARTEPRDSLLVGYAWDAPACSHPHKRLLDEAFPQRPVALPQFGGHALWVNSVVLKQAGIDKFHGPAHGFVERDSDGEPTGILKELGNDSPITHHFHEIFSRKALREPRMRRALDEYRRVGITSIQDNSWYAPVIHTLARWRRSGGLSARVSGWSLGREPATWGAMSRAPFDRLWVRQGPRKYFLDGTFTNRTAWMTEPYRDAPHEYGMGFDPGWLEGVLTRLVRQRRQGAFHSIGDQSTKTFLDVWETVLRKYPDGRDLRMRLEHGQVIRPQDVDRLAGLGVAIAAQPPALANPEKDRSLLGPERALQCYPHRSLLDAGVLLGFGSDIPGESFFDPLRGMDLVCRRDGPQRITAEEALRAYTQGSAALEFEEHRKGTLKVGFLADFAVLSDNPLTVQPSELRNIRVERTVTGARTVWQRALADHS